MSVVPALVERGGSGASTGGGGCSLVAGGEALLMWSIRQLLNHGHPYLALEVRQIYGSVFGTGPDSPPSPLPPPSPPSCDPLPFM